MGLPLRLPTKREGLVGASSTVIGERRTHRRKGGTPCGMSSVVAAIACSAAAGKNPWVPLGLLSLLAAPEEVPSLVMEPELHASLHSMAEPSVLYTLAAIFLTLSLLESLADKIPFVQDWLVPISTAWRPFAAIAVAAVLAWAGMDASPSKALDMADASGLSALPMAAVALAAGTFAGWLATVAKTGIRLILVMLPVPGLKLAHSFVDDFFALGASVAGLAFADSTFVGIIALLYLFIGVFTGPLLARLAWIHVRIMWGLVRKAARSGPPEPVTAPRWLAAHLRTAGIDAPLLLPAYTYKAAEVGRCRSGFLVLADDRVWFACRAFFRPKLLRLDAAHITRIGLAETTTSRVIVVTDESSGTARESRFTLFPAEADETSEPLAAHLESRWARVQAKSASARNGLVGHRTPGPRYVPAERAGSLKAQVAVTLIAAIGLGVVSVGTFIPIGTGYLLSPFAGRFFGALALSAYLTFCVFVSLGFGWPAAVLYGALLNAVAIRDLARQAQKAEVDGYVDVEAFLPPVCDAVWVTHDRVVDPSDRWSPEAVGVPAVA